PRCRTLASMILLLSGLLGISATGAAPAPRELQIVPEHFVLQPGEQVRYTACEPSETSKPRCPDAKFTIADPKIVRMVDPKGIFGVRTRRPQVMHTQSPRLRATNRPFRDRRCPAADDGRAVSRRPRDHREGYVAFRRPRQPRWIRPHCGC